MLKIILTDRSGKLIATSPTFHLPKKEQKRLFKIAWELCWVEAISDGKNHLYHLFSDASKKELSILIERLREMVGIQIPAFDDWISS